jgi:hypothetical protein
MATILMVFSFTVHSVEARQNVCASIDLCDAMGASLILPTWPFPITACPFEGGNTLCCTTCGPSVG